MNVFTVESQVIPDRSETFILLLLKPIDELELSVRAHNCLKNSGIKRILDLVNLSDEESLKIKNFGRKSLSEVKDSMRSFGLTFGMNIKESDLLKVLNAREKEEHKAGS